MPTHLAQSRPLVSANGRRSPSHGGALRLDQPPFARRSVTFEIGSGDQAGWQPTIGRPDSLRSFEHSRLPDTAQRAAELKIRNAYRSTLGA